MKAAKHLLTAILVLLILICPGLSFTALAEGIPRIISLTPDSAEHNYSGPLSIRVLGSETDFQEGKSIVTITDASGRILDYTGGSAAVVNETELSFNLNFGLPPGNYHVQVSTGPRVATGGSFSVRGLPSAAISPAFLSTGYQTREMTVSGINTGFNQNSTLIILDSSGREQSVAGLPTVQHGTALSFILSSGLPSGNYTVRIRTANEEATASLQVVEPSADLRYGGSPFAGLPAGYGSDYNLTLKGRYTDFTAATSLKLKKGSRSGTDFSTYLSGINVQDKETISFILKRGLPSGEYCLLAETGTRETVVSFAVRTPQLSGMQFLSPLAGERTLPQGYREMRVEVYGLDTAFGNNTAVLLNGDTSFVSQLNVESATMLSFTLKPGLSAGNHTLAVDMDGNTATTGDQASLSFNVTSPVLSNLAPSTVVNSGGDPLLLEITGNKTHFLQGSPRVEIEGVPAADIFNVRALSDTRLRFLLRPGSIPAAGTYNIIVGTSGAAINETARGTGLLNVRTNGISAVSPSAVFTDELGGRIITLSGIGTNFASGTKVTVGGREVTPRVNTPLELSFTMPSGLVAGSHYISVDDGTAVYSTSINVEQRGITLSRAESSAGYSSFPLTVYAAGISFDGESNRPVVRISGYGEVALPSAGIAPGSVTFDFPAELPAGAYQVSLSFPQGIYAGKGPFTAEFAVRESAAPLLLFKKMGISVSSLVASPDQDDFTITLWKRQAAGNYIEVTDGAAWSVVYGSDVLSVNGGRISIKGSGTALIRASHGSLQAEIPIEVTSTPGLLSAALQQPILPGGLQPGQQQMQTTGAAAPLKDIQLHWARDNVEKLVALGAITGYPDGTFRPDNSITRAEFAAVLVRAFDLPSGGSGGEFSDTTGHWARDIIASAAARGLVSGYANNRFGPDDPITREQMAAMIVRAAAPGDTNTTESLLFLDEENISPWARSAVAQAFACGLISGYPDNTFKPRGNTTRAEAAEVIIRSLSR